MVVSFSPVAVLRIAKHSESAIASGTTVSGCLVGLDSESGSLEVTNVFLHPAKGAADFQPQQTEDAAATAATTGAEAAAASAAATYQAEAIKLMKTANLDGNIVGWFQTSSLSSFVNEATVEIQFDYQSKNRNSVIVVADPSFGACPVKAFRLTEEYMAFHKAMRERQSQGPSTLITGGPVTFNTGSMSVFQEVEITVDLSILDEAFLFENRERLASAYHKGSDSGSVTSTMQLLMECVEDLAIEKVRFAQMTAGKGASSFGTSRLRGEDEVKRLQSANAIILLTENIRRLNDIVRVSVEANSITCTILEALQE